jgi:predicted glycosyltransferase
VQCFFCSTYFQNVDANISFGIVRWLDHDKTLRELGVSDTDTVVMRYVPYCSRYTVGMCRNVVGILSVCVVM